MQIPLTLCPPLQHLALVKQLKTQSGEFCEFGELFSGDQRRDWPAPEIDDRSATFAIDKGQTSQFTVIFLDIKLLGSPNDVVEVLYRDLDDVIVRIVNDADERYHSG